MTLCDVRAKTATVKEYYLSQQQNGNKGGNANAKLLSTGLVMSSEQWQSLKKQ